ncbi:MAG: helix-turn-helix domain-containing protein [Paramuribaculum sp.]|nr:helix-turn-helix domain-containing protein [Paramuribaculum sp.]
MTDSQAKTLINCMRTLIDKVDNLAAKLSPADRLIDVKGICEVTNFKRTEVYDRIRSGEIPAHKVNGKLHISFNRLQEILPTLK